MIELKNIVKSYGNERVLKGISLKIEDGEFVSIMGESGSGKSTMLSILAGFLSADEGEVLWSGENISGFGDKKMSELRTSKLGFVFQSYRLIPTLNVNDNLLLTATLGKKVDQELLNYAKELAEILKLREVMTKLPGELSGGQAQRVAIARALVYRPEIIVLDEPTGALDSGMERVVMELLAKVNRELGTTVIQVTHSPTVAAYATRTIHLKDGEICEAGKV